MTLNEFERIAREYVGTIIYEKDKVIVRNKNTLLKTSNVYNEHTGEITFVENKPVKVVCEFEFCDSGQFNGEEKTYEILGGFGFPKATEKQVRERFEYYQFKKKERIYEQLLLF